MERSIQREGVREFFDRKAGAYSLTRATDLRFSQIRKIVLSMVAPPNGPVLDLGCGVGTVSQDLVRKNFDVTGIDISEQMITSAQEMRNALDENLRGRLHFLTGTVESMGFPTNTFHQVVCLGVLEYLDDPSSLLREVYRVLAPGGVAIFQVPNKRALGEYTMQFAFKLNQLLGRAQALNIQRKPLASSALDRLLIESGFDVEEISYCYYYLYPFADKFPVLSDRVNDFLMKKNRHWFSDHAAGAFVVKATKPLRIGNC